MNVVGVTKSVTGEDTARIYRLETNKPYLICRAVLSKKCGVFSAFVASQSGSVNLRFSLKGPFDSRAIDFKANRKWERPWLSIQSEIDINPIEVFLEAKGSIQLFIDVAVVFPQLEEALFPSSPINPDSQLPAISDERLIDPPKRGADILFFDSSLVSWPMNSRAFTYTSVSTPAWDTKDIYVEDFFPFVSFANLSENYEISVGASGQYGGRLVIRESSNSSIEFSQSNMIMGKTEYFVCCTFDNEVLSVIINGTLCVSKKLSKRKTFERLYIGASEFGGVHALNGHSGGMFFVPYALLYPRILINYVGMCPTHNHSAYEYMLRYFRYCLVESNEIEAIQRLLKIDSFSQFSKLLQNNLPLIHSEFSPGKNFDEEQVQQILWALLKGHEDVAVERESFAKTGRTDILVKFRNEVVLGNGYRIELKLWSARGYDKAPSQPLKYMLATELMGVFVMIDRRKTAKIENFEKIVMSNADYPCFAIRRVPLFETDIPYFLSFHQDSRYSEPRVIANFYLHIPN